MATIDPAGHLYDRLDAVRDERDHWRGIALSLATQIAGGSGAAEALDSLHRIAAHCDTSATTYAETGGPVEIARRGADRARAAVRLIEESQARQAALAKEAA